MDRIDQHLAVNAKDRSPQPSGGRVSVADYDPGQESQILRIVAKMLALYPRREDPELTLEAYAEELRNIPWRWVSAAMRDLTEEPDRVFGPSISEVKVALAKVIRRARRKANGGSLPEDVSEYRQIDATREIKWLTDRVAADLERGKLPPGVTAQQLRKTTTS